MSLNKENVPSSILNVSFLAGKLKHFLPTWQHITSDYILLNIVKGVQTEFCTYPEQTIIPRAYNFDPTEVTIIDNQLERLLKLE